MMAVLRICRHENSCLLSSILSMTLFCVMLVSSAMNPTHNSSNALQALANELQPFVSNRLPLSTAGLREPQPSLLPPKLYFIHVPKTGGTTLIRLFYNIATAHNQTMIRCIRHLTPSHCRDLTSERPEQHLRPDSSFDPFAFDYVIAHAAYKPPDLHTHSNVCDFTILRHPVRRLLSYYSYLNLPATKVAFQKWYLTPAQRRLANIMTSFLSGIEADHLGHYAIKPGKQHLQQATLRLHKLCFFGLLEDFDDVVQSLIHVGALDAKLTPKEHVAPHQHHLSALQAPHHLQMADLGEALVKRILLDNHLDVALVDYAIRLKLAAQFQP
eukprot:TRINITY_DN12288_c3_g2_i1.p2 TRINITY_DN12288_c3_g2~~TRINITY_DN12288_c3_g2_i1.p2  ORF type:complete len:327 (+),score=41.06 TRINITY_DN12288_c3_g2_i1:3064-4044(+)